MNLYLLTQTVNNDWDTYDSCVVAAENEDLARLISPGGKNYDQESGWFSTRIDGSRYFEGNYSDWALPDQITVKLIGSAKVGTESGLIISSFNAG